jgi:preprotein translocase subunit SecG
MLFAIFLVLFVFVCFGLIFLIIIQSDKGGGISGAIGGGLSGANTLLGTQDASNILTKGTTGFAISYMILCIVLSLFLSKTVFKAPQSALAKRAETQQSYTPNDVLQGGGLPLQAGETPSPAAPGTGIVPEQQNNTPAPASGQPKGN